MRPVARIEASIVKPDDYTVAPLRRPGEGGQGTEVRIGNGRKPGLRPSSGKSGHHTCAIIFGLPEARIAIDASNVTGVIAVHRSRQLTFPSSRKQSGDTANE